MSVRFSIVYFAVAVLLMLVGIVGLFTGQPIAGVG